jgi:hypothetical protein
MDFWADVTQEGNVAQRCMNTGKTGDPGGSRTPNPQIRSLMLYPVELRGRSPKLYHFWGQIAAPCRRLPWCAGAFRCNLRPENQQDIT